MSATGRPERELRRAQHDGSPANAPEAPATPRWLTAQRVMWIVWPAFLMAGVAELVFFSIFDPFDLHLFGSPLEMARESVYAMGFFGFWALGVASSTLSLFLESPPGRERLGTDAPRTSDSAR